jgi:signal transduction histidine kinase
MKGFGYALGKRWDDMTDDQRDLMLTGIVYDADRMDTIVRHLVDAARVMSGGFQPFPERTDVGELVRRLAEQQARDPEHPPVRWTGEDVTVFVDAGRLRTSLLAFVEALVWWGSDGPIEVVAEVPDGRLTVEVSRAAPSDVDVGTLFEARRPGSGGGSKIGLYVARRVAEAQGGAAAGVVRDGRLTFRLDLPLAEADGPTP